MSARIGCASTYQAVIYRRRGQHPAFELSGISQLQWSRRLDETSDCSVVVAKPAAGPNCCARLGEVHPWAYELGIYRDGDIVWQGPIHDVTETRDEVRIDALDVTAWMDVRMNRAPYSVVGAGTDAAQLGRFFVEQAFAVDDPDVLPYLTVSDAGYPGERAAANAYTVFWGEELRELAKTLIDFTTVGRRILIAGDLYARRVPPTATLLAEHFADELTVTRPGSFLGTRQIATGQDGSVPGFAGAAVADPFYGLVERHQTIDSAASTQTTTAAAQVAYGLSYPQPLVVQVPDGATLNQQAPISIEEMVCGTRIDVVLPDYCLNISAAMRLVRANITWDLDGEKVQVTLAPLGTGPTDGAPEGNGA